MIHLNSLEASPCGEYINSHDLNLYEGCQSQSLATQAQKGRHLKLILESLTEKAIQVYLCEDGYIAWLLLDDLKHLTPASQAYQPLIFNRSQIVEKIPQIVTFTQQAMSCPNYYLWGGTLPPNYDCSGLIQAAFSSVGIWLPRDSYQQEEFTQRITQEQLQVGDLIFFGQQKVDHVALYLGDGLYIHSSGKKDGRNGIAIDILSSQGDPIAQHYYQKRWSFGRVTQSLILK